MRDYYVYILANRPGGMLYTGVTNDLQRRLGEHDRELDPGSFTARYGIEHLVFFEVASDARTAIAREKQIKRWRREKKVALIEKRNPAWVDLSRDWRR